MDKGKLSGLLLLDLQKAFDLVNFDILLRKLEHVGIKNTPLTWFRNYLNDRSFKVQVGDVLSDYFPLKHGVPQGSLLGPLLFSLYINDIASCLPNEDCSLFLYADDTGILCSGKTTMEIETKLNNSLIHVSDWLSKNKLSLNLKKCETILFGSAQKLSQNPKPQIAIDNFQIPVKNEVTYLGAILDDRLTGDSHLKSSLSKLHKTTKFLFRQQCYLNFRTRKLVANALLQPIFDYGLQIFHASANQKLKTKLQTSQNKALRFVLNLQPRDHLTAFHFNTLKWLTIEERCNFLTLSLVHKCISGHAPSYLNVFSPPTHRHNTRHSQQGLTLPKSQSVGQKRFKYIGAKQWNNLPREVRETRSLSGFKYRLKSHLRQRAF